MRAFVTGGTGFAGSHLVSQLLADGMEIFALVHPASSPGPLRQNERITALAGDLLAPETLEEALAVARPDVIFHLAGQASPARSWEIPGRTVMVNTIGTINLLEAAVAYGRPRVVVVTSAEIYGEVTPEQMPLDETSAPAPRHPYGVSKHAAAELVPLYAQRYGLPVVEARPFNHIGPGQSLGFVVPDFASQLAAIMLGKRAPLISVGNLDARRDFTDVRDVVAAYRLLAKAGRPGKAYLICSGQPVRIHYLLSTLVELSRQDVKIEYDPARMRPSDVPLLYGTAARLRRDTGWSPRYHLRQSLADALEDWVERLSEKASPV